LQEKCIEFKQVSRKVAAKEIEDDRARVKRENTEKKNEDDQGRARREAAKEKK
jgi:hypothetical protein